MPMATAPMDLAVDHRGIDEAGRCRGTKTLPQDPHRAGLPVHLDQHDLGAPGRRPCPVRLEVARRLEPWLDALRRAGHGGRGRERPSLIARARAPPHRAQAPPPARGRPPPLPGPGDRQAKRLPPHVAAARPTALPAITAARLAKAPHPWLIAAVSPATTVTASGVTPSSAAHTWARVVSAPCPWEVPPVKTVTRPAVSTRTHAPSYGPTARQLHVAGDPDPGQPPRRARAVPLAPPGRRSRARLQRAPQDGRGNRRCRTPAAPLPR